MSDVQCGLAKLPNFKLVSGVGNYDENTACVMSAAVACYRLSKGESIGKATDEMDCCCPVIRAFLIKLNDSSLWQSDAHRTDTLMPFVPRLANTKNDALTQQRAYILADFAVRNIAARAMDSADLQGQAKKLRELPEIINAKTARSAADAADAPYAADAAYAAEAAARSAARSAAYAADAADAAEAAARSAARSAAYAADAAYAAEAAARSAARSAAYAAAYADTKNEILAACVKVIERLISLSE